MSDFVFGTRYRYSTTNDIDWDVNSEITYKYDDCTKKPSASKDSSIVGSNDAGDIGTVYTIKELGLEEGIKIRYRRSGVWKPINDKGNPSFTTVSHFGLSKDGLLMWKVGNWQIGVDANDSIKIYDNNGAPIEYSYIKNKIESYLLGHNADDVFQNQFEINGTKTQESSEFKKDESPYNNGFGKYLRLRIFKGTVADIGSYLGNGLVRKDNLFKNSSDWKDYAKSSDRAYPIEVDDCIKLIPENFVFRSGFKYSLGMATEVTNSGPFKTINNLAGGAAMIDALSKSLKNSGGVGEVSFNERINRFRNIPYFKDLDNNCIDSLMFKFNFGQFEKYDCLEEVVKPILALVSIFSYSFRAGDEPKEITEDKELRNGNALYINTNFENKFNLMTRMYNSLFQNTQSALKTILNESKSQTASSLAAIPEVLTNLVNRAAMENRTQAFTFAIGSSIYGPYYASNVRWEFDYERTDKNGLPFAGTITLGGIKPLLVESLEGLLMTGGQIIENG